MPQRLTGMTGGEAEMNAGGELADAAADLDQAQAHRLQRHPRRACLHQPAAEGVEEAVGRPVEEQAHLVGQKAMTGEAVAETAEFEILDPVFRLAAIGVPGIE